MMTQNPTRLPVAVCGAGAAGITAALDLTKAGRQVLLIEKTGSLGGQAAGLDKLYPTDHCGFCPIQTQARLCLSHPLISVHLYSAISLVEKAATEHKADATAFRVVISTYPNRIDWNLCISCGLCRDTCPETAISASLPHALPVTYAINPDKCTDCGACKAVCPAGCIDLSPLERAMSVNVSDIIWATGFKDADISGLPEFGSRESGTPESGGFTHPGMMTSLEFERFMAESGPGRGKLGPIDDHPVKRIAFIQCAGARDRRRFPFCSAVCCMHALKQARWVKRRDPDMACVIFYTDMRTEGRHYYTYYRDAVENQAIELIRARPGLITPLASGSGLAVRFEDTRTGRMGFEKFDMVVLNGALSPSGTGTITGKSLPETDGCGFITDRAGQHACGFCREPADVETSAVQASGAAINACMSKQDGMNVKVENP